MYKKTLGEKLRGLREDHDLKQKELAKYLNVDRSTYSYYESDKNQPSLDSIVKLAIFYGISTDDLLI